MSYLEILGLVVTGGGTIASILGVFFAIYAKQNGKVTREFMAKTIAEENKNMKEFLATVLERMDRKGEERHLEVLSRIEKPH
ncbi:MAG: hypothetical protein AB1797_13035 [bacterium]